VPPSDSSWASDRPGGALIRVRVKPRASRDQIEAVTPDGLLSVRLTAPPVENQANARLIETLAKALCLPKSALVIDSGDKSRVKRVMVSGLSASEIQAKLFSPR